jgi:flagellar hook-associated protein 1
VFIGGGQRLVLGTEPTRCRWSPTRTTPRAARWRGRGASRGRSTPGLLGGGSLAGLLRFQNSDLVHARTLLGQLAASIAAAVNGQHQLGMDLGQPSGRGRALFTGLADLAADAVRPAAANERDAQGAFAAAPTLQVVDASRLQASEYELAAVIEDGAPSWQLRRLSDDRRFTLQPGEVVDGLRIDLGDPPPAATDRFLLQPVSRAADRMAVLLRDPRELAAASPLSAAVDSANTGTMAVDALTVTADGADPQLTAVIGFTSDDGDYAWELRDRDSDALMGSGSGRWRAGEPIPSAPDADINGFSLRLSGVPRSGDSLTVERTLYPAANNGNAQALAALRDGLSVAQTSGGALSFNEAYAGALAEVGVRVQGARSAAGISGAVAAQAETQRAQGSGVNLDEEAARLIQYQQSYQAAAKVLQIAQQVFDLLLDVAAGR